MNKETSNPLPISLDTKKSEVSMTINKQTTLISHDRLVAKVLSCINGKDGYTLESIIVKKDGSDTPIILSITRE